MLPRPRLPGVWSVAAFTAERAAELTQLSELAVVGERGRHVALAAVPLGGEAGEGQHRRVGERRVLQEHEAAYLLRDGDTPKQDPVEAAAAAATD